MGDQWLESILLCIILLFEFLEVFVGSLRYLIKYLFLEMPGSSKLEEKQNGRKNNNEKHKKSNFMSNNRTLIMLWLARGNIYSLYITPNDLLLSPAMVAYVLNKNRRVMSLIDTERWA